MSIWITLAGMGLVTFGVRVVPFLAIERLRLSPRVVQALTFVPVAVLSAILAQEVFAPSGDIQLGGGNQRIIAAFIAAAVAWRTKSVLLTVGAGMSTLWLVNWLG